MPIYEYRCEECGKVFEELVFGETQVVCPDCSSTKTAKLMSACRRASGYDGGYAGDGNISYSGSASGCAGCSGGSCSTCK